MIFLLCAFAAAPPVADPLPEGAIARLGTTRFRHGFITHALAVSADGRTIASGGNGRGLCLWDAATGELRHHLNTRRAPSAYGVAFSPDGKRVVTSESPYLMHYDVATGKELHRFEGHTNGVISSAYSAHGWVASGSHDQTVRLWDAKTGEVRHILEGFKATPWRIAAHPEADELAAASLDGVVSVWDGRTGMKKWSAVGHMGDIVGLAYCPAGDRLVSAGADGSVRLSGADGTPRRVLALGGRRARSVAISRTHVAAGFEDATIRLYDLATGREARRWLAGNFGPGALAFTPDGRAVVSGGVWRTRIDRWDVATGKALDPTTGHPGPVDFLRFHGDTLLSVGRERTAILWDVKARRGRTVPLPGTTGSLASIALSLDAKLAAVATYRDRTLWVVDLATGKTRHEFPTERLSSLVFGPGGRLAAFDMRGELRVYDAASGKLLTHMKEGLGEATRGRFFGAVAFAPDGRRLALGDDSGFIRLVDVVEKKVLAKFEAGVELGGFAFSPDGRTLAVSGAYGRPVVVLLDGVTGEVIRSWQTDQTGVYGVAFSEDGRRLATAGDELDNRVIVWEARTAKRIATFVGHHSSVLPVAFAPDGRTLASGGGDSTVLLWDLTTRLKGTPEECWAALGADDAGKAHRAAWGLVSSPREAVALLEKKLTPAKAMDDKRLSGLLERLGAEDFEARQAAEAELRKHGPGVGRALEAVVKAQPLESRRRIERLLKEWRESADALREDRAVMALQQMGEPARSLLERLASGASGADLTEAAKRSLRETK